jgi:hypothetical protein
LDYAEWLRVKTLLASKNGPRLLQLAGLSPDTGDLPNVTLVREATWPDSPVHLAGTVIAERTFLKWRFRLEETTLLGPGAAERPRPLSAFPGRVLVVNQAKDAAQFAALARRLEEIRAPLQKAVAAMTAERKGALLELLKPKSLFVGTAVVKPSPTPTPGAQRAGVCLEITEVRADEDPPRLTALLRNDGGGTEQRMFSGELVFAPAAGRFQLKLASPASEAEENAGPFLSDYYDSFNLGKEEDAGVLWFDVADHALVADGASYTLRLERVADAERDKVLAALAGDRPALLAATQPGTTYSGTITNRIQGSQEKFLLRFTKQEKEGRELEAVLEHPDRATWKCSFEGTLDTNRYRAQGNPIELRRGGIEFVPPDDMVRCFETDDQTATFPLHLEGTKLLGENRRFVFRFERASP